jgi:hypothetical protein
MKVTRKQLFDIVRNALNEVNYYTKKFTLGEEEAAKKLESDFDDNSTLPWSSSYDEELKTVTLKSTFETSVRFCVSEPQGQKYTVKVYYGDDVKPFTSLEGLSPQQLRSDVISKIDEIACEVITDRIQRGEK